MDKKPLKVTRQNLKKNQSEILEIKIIIFEIEKKRKKGF